jgi:predicted NAD/FAD-binding protein
LITLEEYTEQLNYSSEFLENMLLPTLAAICTCSEKSVLAYPAYIVVDYLTRRHLRGVRRVRGGTSEAAARFVQFCDVKLNSSVIQIIDRDQIAQDTTINQDENKISSKVHVHSKNHVTGEVSVDTFDDVIIATQANHAASFLSNSSKLTELLSLIPYERSELVLHTDASLMPANKQSWRSVNFILGNTFDKQTSVDSQKITLADCMASIWMNRAQTGLNEQLTNAKLFEPNSSSTPLNIIQTWNPLKFPSSDKLLTAVHFERPVVTKESLTAIQELWSRQGSNGIWFVGSYLSEGMPLLEAGVTTSLRVCQKFNVTPSFLGKNSISTNSCDQNNKTEHNESLARKTCKIIVMGLGVTALTTFVGAFIYNQSGRR